MFKDEEKMYKMRFRAFRLYFKKHISNQERWFYILPPEVFIAALLFSEKSCNRLRERDG